MGPGWNKLNSTKFQPLGGFKLPRSIVDGILGSYFHRGTEGDTSGAQRQKESLCLNDICSRFQALNISLLLPTSLPNIFVCFQLCTSTYGEVMVKIADFGLARRIYGPIYTVCGTPTYVAPEILTEEGYGVEVDIWAAGVILYIMLCGFPPFRSSKRRQTELFELIEAGEFEFLQPYWDDVTDLAKHLVTGMITVNKRERYTAAEVLEHDWLKAYGLRRTNTTLGEPGDRRTYRTLGKGPLALEKFSHLERIEREAVEAPPVKLRRSRSGIT